MRYPLLPNCIFRETFDSALSVAQNGGVVAGTPTIANGYTTTVANAQSIYYPRRKGVLNGATKFIVDIDFTTGNNITTNTKILTEWDNSGTVGFTLELGGGNLVFYLNSASNYAYFTLAVNTRYRLRYSYDGSQATNALKLVCYKDGAVQALTSAGTIPTVMSSGTSYTLAVNGTNGTASIHVAGFIIREIAIYKGVSSSAEEALDAYQQDTITELDASKALIHLPLRSWYYNGSNVAVTDNIGSLGGTATLGDGSTTTTFPTQIAPHGMSFDGGDYLKISNFDAGLLGNSGTVIVFVKFASLPAGTHALMILGEPATYASGFLINQDAKNLALYWKSAGATVSVGDILTLGSWQMVAMVNNGGSVSMVVDDLWEGLGNSGGSISGSLNLYVLKSATDWNGVNGSALQPMVYPNALTPTQLRDIRQQFFKDLNV